MGPSEVVSGQLGLAVAILVGVVVIAFLMLVTVFLFKGRRDRAEARSREMRAAFRGALEAHDPAAIDDIVSQLATRHMADQTDLLVVLSNCWHEPWWNADVTRMLHDSFERRGFSDMLERQLGSRSPARRGTAVLLGANPGTRLPAAELAELLRDPDPTVRLSAVAALEREENDAAAEVLIDALAVRAIPEPRIIERLGHRWAVPVCLTRLRATTEDSPRHLRGALARTLALAGDPIAIPDLMWLLDAGSPEEQVQAMRALAACATEADDDQCEQIASAARARLFTPSNPLTLMACIALGETGDVQDIGAFSRLLSHPDWHVRRAAARALREMGAPGLQVLLIVASGPDRYAAQRASEELAMAHLGLDELGDGGSRG